MRPLGPSLARFITCADTTAVGIESYNDPLPSTSQAHEAAAKIASLGAPYKQISQLGWLRRPDYAHLNYALHRWRRGFLSFPRMGPDEAERCQSGSRHLCGIVGIDFHVFDAQVGG